MAFVRSEEFRKKKIKLKIPILLGKYGHLFSDLDLFCFIVVVVVVNDDVVLCVCVCVCVCAGGSGVFLSSKYQVTLLMKTFVIRVIKLVFFTNVYLDCVV